jgi:hypothetical protein
MEGEREFVTVPVGDNVPTDVAEGELVVEDDLDDVGVAVKTAVTVDAPEPVLDTDGEAVVDTVATVELVGKGLELADGVEVVDVVSELCAENVFCDDSVGVAVRVCSNEGEADVELVIVTETMEVTLIEAQPDVVRDPFKERETDGDVESDCHADAVLTLVRVSCIDAVADELGLIVGVVVSERETTDVNVSTAVTEGEAEEEAAAVADLVPRTDAVNEGDVDGDMDADTVKVGDALDVDVGLGDMTAESVS